MQNALVAYQPGRRSTTPEALSPGAEETARRALAHSTLNMYRSVSAKLDQWLQARGWEASDLTIAEYMQHEHARGIAPGTICVRRQRP